MEKSKITNSVNLHLRIISYSTVPGVKHSTGNLLTCPEAYTDPGIGKRQ